VIGRAVLWVTGGLLILLTTAWRSGLRLNLTGSLPVGLYMEIQGVPERGSIVLACLPLDVAVFARERGYVPRGDRCPGRTAPVGKTVMAIVGDTVTVSAIGLEVNGHPIPNSRPRAFDTHGRPLTSAPVGRSVVSAGNAWLVSSYTPLSFDSRYFGAIETRSLIAVVRPLWTATRR
jgi:conjugative transfer signal peptidase TraF